MSGAEKLGQFLKEVSNWEWDEFCLAENDPKYTSSQAMIFALVRSCAMQKMDAIKISLNRLDGKLKTPVRIEYPKIFYLYPNAKIVETNVEEMKKEIEQHNEREKNLKHLPGGVEIVQGEVLPPEPEVEQPDLPSLGLRETLAKMADLPREVPDYVVQMATLTQQWINRQADKPDEIPKVKSVVAAHLLILAQSRNIDAISEVFDSIDGKLAETIQLLGEDLFITSYALVAPEGAEKNGDGVYQIEAHQVQQMWAQKLGKGLS